MNTKEIRDLVIWANKGDIPSLNMLIDMFQPLIKKKSYIDGQFNEDCFQELNIKFINCIHKFKLDNRGLESITPVTVEEIIEQINECL